MAWCVLSWACLTTPESGTKSEVLRTACQHSGRGAGCGGFGGVGTHQHCLTGTADVVTLSQRQVGFSNNSTLYDLGCWPNCSPSAVPYKLLEVIREYCIQQPLIFTTGRCSAGCCRERMLFRKLFQCVGSTTPLSAKSTHMVFSSIWGIFCWLDAFSAVVNKHLQLAKPTVYSAGMLLFFLSCFCLLC